MAGMTVGVGRAQAPGRRDQPRAVHQSALLAHRLPADDRGVVAGFASLEVREQASSDAIADDEETLGLRIFVGERGFKVVGKDTDVNLPCLGSACVERRAGAATPESAGRGARQRAPSPGQVSHYDYAKLATLLAEKRALFPTRKTSTSTSPTPCPTTEHDSHHGHLHGRGPRQHRARRLCRMRGAP